MRFLCSPLFIIAILRCQLQRCSNITQREHNNRWHTAIATIMFISWHSGAHICMIRYKWVTWYNNDGTFFFVGPKEMSMYDTLVRCACCVYDDLMGIYTWGHVTVSIWRHISFINIFLFSSCGVVWCGVRGEVMSPRHVQLNNGI